jgi:hypothetical protein
MKRLALVLLAALTFPALAYDGPLSLVPANAVSVGMVRLSDLRSSPLSSVVFQHLDRIGTDGEAAGFLREAGLQPFEDVDTLVVATSPRTSLGTDADVLVVAEGRFQPERLAAALVAHGATRKGGYILLDDPDEGETGAVAFVSASLTIAGNERSVVRALEAYAAGGTGFLSRGGLAMDLARIEPGATSWALVDVTRAARLARTNPLESGAGSQANGLQTALKSVATVALWTKDRGDALQLGATAVARDAETPALIEDTLRGALAAARLAVADQVPDLVPVLRRFEVTRNGQTVAIEGSIPADVVRQLMTRAVASAR